MFLDRQEDRQLSTTTQNAKGKQELFLYLKQASSTRLVLDAKRFYNEDSHSRLSKRKTCINPILGYQEVTYISLRDFRS